MNPKQCVKAVILAAGVGSRMRRADETAALSAAQLRAAANGSKAMMPFARPFLGYVLTSLADAGFQEICLVVRPQAAEIRSYYLDVAPLCRFKMQFAVQSEPRGTAHATLAAEAFAAGDRFVLINGDNLYPTEALSQLRTLDGCGLVGFERDSMLGDSNVAAERITGFAVVCHDEAGDLNAIIEKPSQATLDSLPPPILLSMNCWLFDPDIFASCRAVKLSPRGEFELPDAVLHCVGAHKKRFYVVPCRWGVWDLSRQADIPQISHILDVREVRL